MIRIFVSSYKIRPQNWFPVILRVQRPQCSTALSLSLSLALCLGFYAVPPAHSDTTSGGFSEGRGLVWRKRMCNQHSEPATFPCTQTHTHTRMQTHTPSPLTDSVWNVTLLCQDRPKCASPLTNDMKRRMSITLWL